MKWKQTASSWINFLNTADLKTERKHMIYKVFYQETKDRSPRRETTRSLYLDIDANSELEGTYHCP